MLLADLIERQRRRLAANGALKIMLWAYFDETAVDAQGVGGRKVFEHMLVGGCVSTAMLWRKFELEWQKALDDEGISVFHGNDFYSYNGEFRWFLNGKPDVARQSAFRDRLANIILDNVKGVMGFFGEPKVGTKTVLKSYDECVSYILRDMHRSTNEKNSVTITLARRDDVGPWRLLKMFQNHNWQGRLAGCGIYRPQDVVPLQAGDFVMHAMNSRWRDAPNESFKILVAGAKLRGIPMTLSLNGSPSSPGMPASSGRIGFSAEKKT